MQRLQNSLVKRVQFSSVQFSSHGRKKFVSSFLEINPLECNAME